MRRDESESARGSRGRVITRESGFSGAGRLLRVLVRLSCRWPAWTIALSLMFGVLGAASAVSRLGFETSTRALLPQSAGYVLRYSEYAKDFGELEDIVVVVEATSFETARTYADRLTIELGQAPVPFPRIAYRVDPKRFEGRHLLYLPTAKLEEVRDKIFDHQDFIERFAADPSLASLLEGVNRQVAAAFVANFLDLGLQERGGGFDPHFIDVLLDQLMAHLGGDQTYRSPWRRLVSIGDASQRDTAGYFVPDDKRVLFVLVEAPAGVKGSFVGDRNAIAAIREAIARLQPLFPDVKAGVTGAPALSNDERSAAFHDSEVAAALAFALTLVLMMVAFRRAAQPLLLLGVLAVTLAWALGIVSLTVGHLTLFSVMFISIVIGVGIDYGVYFLSRYREEMLLGRSVNEALEHTAERTGPGILIAAFTAGGTFLVLLLTDFRGIQELGFVAGISILLAGLSMMTTFPALLRLLDRHRAARSLGDAASPDERRRVEVPILNYLARRPGPVLIPVAVVTALSCWGVYHVEFDYNVLNLQARGTESVTWEKRALQATGRSGFSALSTATDLPELRRKQEAFEQLPSVAEVDSVLRVIPDDQLGKIAIIDSFAPLVAGLRVQSPGAVDSPRLRAALTGLARRLGVAVAESERPPRDVVRILEKIGRLLGALDRIDHLAAERALGGLQTQLFRDFADMLQSLRGNLRPTPVTVADIPEELRRKFIGSSGQFLMQVHPRGNTWEKEGAARFVGELRSVVPDVTGASVITYEATLLMERAYVQGTIYAFALVATLSALMLGRLRETLLAMVPLVLGLSWTIGLLHLFGITFNLANIWALPLIIGTSAEFGLNVVLRNLEGRAHGGPLVARSTVMAVALNGLIMMGGFGSLMIASHRGIFSLGLLLTVGTACGVLASLVVVPVGLRLLTRQDALTAETRRERSALNRGGERIDDAGLREPTL
jgi:uncharacterized protein